ncbi:MAG: Lipid-A-disaccharide synthase [Pseudomonadota bacterium]|jgi:lipid-A-disaccharide synthase
MFINNSIYCDNILIVTGESSGDILASYLLKGLRQEGCNWPVWGIGGQRLSALGMECVENIDNLAVRGYAEVLPALPRLWLMRRTLMAQAAQRRPRVCITVDAPDFNLTLAAKLKLMGIPTIHFISPSIWAWRRERLINIKSAIDTMLCVFPHEVSLYHAVGMRAQYVGHPMAQAIPLTINRVKAKQNLCDLLLDINQTKLIPSIITLVAMLPGSRETELNYIFPKQLAAATLLLKKNIHLHFVVPIVSDSLMLEAQKYLAKYPDLPLTLLRGQAELILSAADVGLIASGTATLEAALYRLPMVICYNMPHTSWLIMRRKNYLPWVGLPNILYQESIVPELLQNAATPAALAEAIWSLLQDTQRMVLMREKFSILHQRLYCNTQSLAARAVIRQCIN